MSDITEHPDPRDADLIRRLTNRLADGITSVTLDSSTTPPTVSFTPDESLMAEALADLSRLREERDALQARTTPPAIEVYGDIRWLTESGNDGGCFLGATSAARIGAALRHAYDAALPPVAPSPDPNGGEQ